MKKVGELRRRAERYRQLERQITDDRAVKALSELVDETEMTAAELEKRHHTRERAHEIWIERGRPHGRDVEFWLAAEREMEQEGRVQGESGGMPDTLRPRCYSRSSSRPRG